MQMLLLFLMLRCCVLAHVGCPKNVGDALGDVNVGGRG